MSNEKIYTAILVIKDKTLDKINHYLHDEPKNEDECLGEDTTITHSVKFPNNMVMDIKCCGVQFEENNPSNCAWTEAVLFYNGCEMGCSEVEDEYEGKWELVNFGAHYIVFVIRESDINKWHRAEDKFPPETLPVFVTYKHFYNGSPISETTGYYYDGEWYWTDYEDSSVAVEITHWRYLPNGPQYSCN